jgi:plasmid maintenance system antidote protein VapI
MSAGAGPALGSPLRKDPQLWMNLQKNLDLDRARQKLSKAISHKGSAGFTPFAAE